MPKKQCTNPNFILLRQSAPHLIIYYIPPDLGFFYTVCTDFIYKTLKIFKMSKNKSILKIYIKEIDCFFKVSIVIF